MKGGRLQQLLLFPGLLQARGASLAPGSIRGYGGMAPPESCALQGSPTHSIWGLGPPCTPASVANPTVHSEDRSLGKVVTALSGREPGIHTYTPPEG